MYLHSTLGLIYSFSLILFLNKNGVLRNQIILNVHPLIHNPYIDILTSSLIQISSSKGSFYPFKNQFWSIQQKWYSNNPSIDPYPIAYHRRPSLMDGADEAWRQDQVECGRHCNWNCMFPECPSTHFRMTHNALLLLQTRPAYLKELVKLPIKTKTWSFGHASTHHVLMSAQNLECKNWWDSIAWWKLYQKQFSFFPVYLQ